ncbi:MAG: hypothetical protein Q4P13_12000 [Psychrobacter sp.]|nr:hypothetical protein [Psychrobacter sp.]
MSEQHSNRSQDKKRHLIERYLTKLTQEDPQLYYSSTDEIARVILTMIKQHSLQLDIEEQLLANHMTLSEVEMLLSFHDHSAHHPKSHPE